VPDHWVPDMMAAGAVCGLVECGEQSRYVPQDETHEMDAGVVVNALCEYERNEG